jgi:hypothetical protein
MKPTKNDYKMKIDMINTKCDEIMMKYESDKEIFKYNEINSIKSNREELEQLCYLMKSMILCEILTISEDKMKQLNDKTTEVLNWLADIDVKKKYENIVKLDK